MKLATILAVVLTYALLVILGIQITGLHDQMGTLQQQLRQDQAQLAAVSAKASGGHRDLITCGDLQVFTWPVTVSGTDAYGNGLNLSGITEQLSMLPAHCINQ